MKFELCIKYGTKQQECVASRHNDVTLEIRDRAAWCYIAICNIINIFPASRKVCAITRL